MSFLILETQSLLAGTKALNTHLQHSTVLLHLPGENSLYLRRPKVLDLNRYSISPTDGSRT
jgi:hypothetical protein